MLPPDLRSAESEALAGLCSALAADPRGRWTVELRFEGLRLLPVVLRLTEALEEAGVGLRLLFADAGAAALARRDGPGLAPRIASFSDQLRLQKASAEPGASAADATSAEVALEPASAPVLLLVGAAQAEYDEVEELCRVHPGAVVLINPGLEDAAVGIGSVARQRRRGFLSQLQAAYALLPLPGAALRRLHPGDWELYRLDADGYRLLGGFDHRPDGEEREALLSGGEGAGLGSTLRSVDRLIEGLQR